MVAEGYTHTHARRGIGRALRVNRHSLTQSVSIEIGDWSREEVSARSVLYPLGSEWCIVAPHCSAVAARSAPFRPRVGVQPGLLAVDGIRAQALLTAGSFQQPGSAFKALPIVDSDPACTNRQEEKGKWKN